MEIKDYSDEVAEHREVDEQMPHQVVVAKTLLGVDGCAEGVEDSASAN